MSDRRLRELERAFAASGSPADELAYRQAQVRQGGADGPQADLRVGQLTGAWPPALAGPGASDLAALLGEERFMAVGGSHDEAGALSGLAQRLADPAPWQEPPAEAALAHPAVEDAADNHARQRWRAQEVLQRVAERVPGLRAGHLVRAFQLMLPVGSWLEVDVERWRCGAVADLLREARPGSDLEDAAVAFAQAGLDDAWVGAQALYPRGPVEAWRPFPPGAYYARRPELVATTLAAGIRQAVGSWRTSLEAALREILAEGFPAGFPTPLLDALVTAALGKAKGLAKLASGALDGVAPPTLVASIERVSAGRRGALRSRADAWRAELGA